jgi:hypothetical protein
MINFKKATSSPSTLCSIQEYHFEEVVQQDINCGVKNFPGL